MLIETQVVRSTSELLKELQGLPVTKAVIYRNVDRKAWEQIAGGASGATVVFVDFRSECHKILKDPQRMRPRVLLSAHKTVRNVGQS